METINKAENKTINVINSVSKILSSMLYGVVDATNAYANSSGTANSSATSRKPLKGGIGKEDIEVTISEQPESSLAINAVEKGTEYVMKAIATVADSFAPIVEEMIFGDLANKSWAEVAPNINRIMKQKTENLDLIIQNPEFLEALRELTRAYTTVGIELMDILKPSLEQIIDEGISMLSDAGTKGVSGLINTGFNIGEAAIAEIPVAGGIIELIIAFIRGFNQAMIAAAPVVQFGTESVGTAIKNANEAWSVVEQGKQKIDEASAKLQELQQMPSQMLKQYEEKGRKLGESTLQNVITNPLQQTTQKMQSKIENIVPKPSALASAALVPKSSTFVPASVSPKLALEPKTTFSQTKSIAETQLGGKKNNPKQLFKRINKTAKRIASSVKGFNSLKSKTTIKHRKTKKAKRRY